MFCLIRILNSTRFYIDKYIIFHEFITFLNVKEIYRRRRNRNRKPLLERTQGPHNVQTEEENEKRPRIR